jgi:tetratricopeptide (TPR) repeat protein
LDETKPEEAVVFKEKATQTLRALAEQFPDSPDYQSKLCMCYMNLGNSLSRLNQKQQAVDALRNGVEVGSTLVSKFPAVLDNWLYLAGNRANLADIYLEEKRYQEALSELDAAVECLRHVREKAPDNKTLIQFTGIERRKRAQCLQEMAWLLATDPNDEKRDGEQALAWAKEACELSGWTQPACLDTLATAYAECGDFEQAVKWETEALDALPDQIPEEAVKALEARRALFERGLPYHRPANSEPDTAANTRKEIF